MKKRILVIDDFTDIRKLFVRSLEDTCYKVDTAASGEIGIKMHKRAKYNLIFLDLNMPGMSGIDTLREIRKSDTDVPVYIVTALYKDYLEEIKKAFNDGINFFIAHKPITPDQIAVIVTETLGGLNIDKLIKGRHFTGFKKAKVPLDLLLKEGVHPMN